MNLILAKLGLQEDVPVQRPAPNSSGRRHGQPQFPAHKPPSIPKKHIPSSRFLIYARTRWCSICALLATGYDSECKNSSIHMQLREAHLQNPSLKL